MKGYEGDGLAYLFRFVYSALPRVADRKWQVEAGRGFVCPLALDLALSSTPVLMGSHCLKFSSNAKQDRFQDFLI